MGEIVSLKDREKSALATLSTPAMQRMLSAALPGVGIKPATFARWCVTALRRQPQLLNCSEKSLFGAMVQSAQLGLDPSGVTGQAYLVPFGNECTFVPGYKGLIQLAYRSGQIASIDAHAVRANDKFHYEYGLTPKLTHTPFDGDRGELTHSYSVAQIKGGGAVFAVLTKPEVVLIRESSASARSRKSPWVTHEESMWMKSAVRRLSKLLPLSTEVARAFELSEQDERGIPAVVSLDEFSTAVPADATVTPTTPTVSEFDAEESRRLDAEAARHA